MLPDELTRRDVLRAGTAAPAFFGPFDSSDESESNHLEYDGSVPQFPDHIVDPRDDLTELENYQPRLVTQNQQAREDMTGMYGWSADSENHDVTAHYYWVRSNTQRSIFSYFGIDAGPEEHHLDHEPVIVFEAPDGSVEKVVHSGGHHMAAEIDGEWGHLIEDRVADRRTHVVLEQMRPHNHFVEAPDGEDGGYVQGYAEFGSWLDKRDPWFSYGRYAKTSDVAVVDPFAFYPADGRQHWWRADTNDAWFARNIYVPLTTAADERGNLRYQDS
ncbi:hypothetical protein [Halopiger xanaduensis]|uniref:Uncharacterized protein n=1 Tax=Halopiger xanaduensis (strain DSM 18323 / JCM 14033 / SH-6) TaxID=797210 RepID=F8DEV2_HALXS|nr:hypothetical protein [Halopiger xanaduensis]AEH39542.1 hypothetical protein Halxa_0303 [Halopiger xanaduensis SH-6]